MHLPPVYERPAVFFYRNILVDDRVQFLRPPAALETRIPINWAL